MLKHEAGYQIIAETDEYLEFERPADFVKNKPAEKRELTEEVKARLTKRCNAIADIFLDPVAFRDEIVQRIRNITRTMSSVESDFCWDWVERNLDNLT